MSLKLRIILSDDQAVSSNSSTEELLTVLLNKQQGLIMLDSNDEETLRGWLLMHAGELDNGAIVTAGQDKSVCIGKTSEGRAFVRDHRGDWPPIKPEFGKNPFQ
jgi:hypothetical protein